MVRFLHTGDWQLGMTRHYFADEAQAHFSQARIDAIAAIGRAAAEHAAEFVVVCGDVFETNQVDQRTVTRALDALATVPVPVYLLPGNHDPLDAGSVFHRASFTRRSPPHVHVIQTREPIALRGDVEIVGAPWTSKRPLEDLVQRACETLAATRGSVRIVVAHGAVDTLSPKQNDPAAIDLAAAERLLAEGRIHYLALGDRHSRTSVGASGRVHYAGAPEPTDFDEVDAGQVLVVEATPETIDVRPVRVGTWSFVRRPFELASDADLEAFERELRVAQDKQRTALKLDLLGTLSLRQKARLDELLDEARDAYAAIVLSKSGTELAVAPNDGDFADLRLSGFAAVAAQRLRDLAGGSDDQAETARRALALLLRLTESGA